ncbi:mitochondrial carrier domain-containing protein [Limtongia smithiae]|uniref:mitochondrial carrier domain-containing protein n=1 Tax=Limtongia smithiae TaxID=1125753 RepID=UPI0034CFE206
MTTLDSPRLLPASASAAVTTSKARHALSGFVSGFTAAVLLQPLDLVKTRVQQGAGTTTVSTSFREILAGSGEQERRTTTSHVRRLWRGTLPSVFRTSVGSGLYFTLLHSVRSFVHRHESSTTDTNLRAAQSSVLPRIPGAANLAAGAAARGTAGFIMMPVTVLKVRFESSRYASMSLLETARAVYAAHGMRGFFYGYGATFVRDVPYAGVYVWTYEYAKGVLPGLLLRDRSADGQSTVLLPSTMAVGVNASCAAVSAMVATTLTNPFDTVKTRMQLFPDTYGTNMWTAFARIAAEQPRGMRSFLDGLGIRIVRKALTSGIAWCVYEEMVRR